MVSCNVQYEKKIKHMEQTGQMKVENTDTQTQTAVRVGIVDYGVGNLFSLKSSFAAIGVFAQTVAQPQQLSEYTHLVLPGVGAFGDASEKLRACGMAQALCRQAEEGKPLLGICLGMQLLLEKSYEYGEHAGLGLIPGEVRPIAEVIPATYKIPQIGWNALQFPANRPKSVLFAQVEAGEYVYFVHSYHATNCEPFVSAVDEYGAMLTAAVERDHVYGTQFHPEKSGDVGLRILRAFCHITGK